MAFDWRVLLSALSTAAPMLAQARGANRAQDELARGRQEQMAAQVAADKRIGDEVMSLSTSSGEAERKASTADYTAAVRKARGDGNASLPSSLGGERYQADTAASTAGNVAYGNRTADQFARIDAPARQRQVEQQGVARAGLDVGREQRRATSADYLAQIRAKNRAQVNPWVKILSQLGSQIANNYEPSSLSAADNITDYLPAPTNRRNA